MCFNRVNVCPLGSGALAGSTLPLDREFVAELLGFVDSKGKRASPRTRWTPSATAISSSSSCAAGAARRPSLAPRRGLDPLGPGVWVHPHRRRLHHGLVADAAEEEPGHCRTRAARPAASIGNLVALLTLLKGLPMTYNRDLQEDKERLFDTADTVRATAAASWPPCSVTRPCNRAGCAAAASDPALLATDLADYLVQQGHPFRQAHHAVGAPSPSRRISANSWTN